MAEIPHSWEAYARLQRKLLTTSWIRTANALEEALNVVHDPDFRPEAATDVALETFADSASRRARRRARLVRRHFAEQTQNGAEGFDGDVGPTESLPQSLDDQVHAQSELIRLEVTMCEPDWTLLTDVAFGASYEELAIEQESSASALRSRVCRLRQAIG